MTMGRHLIIYIALLLVSTRMAAQQHVGMAGMIHVPTAELDSAGVARVGAQYVPKEMIPDRMTCDGEKFNSLTNYLSITPFHWIEIGYGYTLWKLHRNKDVTQPTGFYAKDRYFSVVIRPLREGRYWPSVAIGGNDVWGSSDSGESSSKYYQNFYIALSKHFDLKRERLGLHVAYRKWKRDYNHKWDGVVGGVTYNPSFYRPLRLMAEWDGTEVNIGADCRLFKYFLVQTALVNFRYFTGGLCLYIDLF